MHQRTKLLSPNLQIRKLPKPKRHTKMVPYCFIIITNCVCCNGQTISNEGNRQNLVFYTRDLFSDFFVFMALPSELRNHSFLHPIFPSPKHSHLSRLWRMHAASYPQLPASPVWNKLCPGCFLPHIGTVLHLPFVHYGSLSSPIQELQCGNFPAKDRNMGLKTALVKDTLALFHWFITVLSTQDISLYPIYEYQHILLRPCKTI